MKPTLDETEAIILDVIDGRRPFLDGLRSAVAYQRAWNAPLADYWSRHGFHGEPRGPEDVPGVPTDVFRHVRLVSAERPPTIVFRTSGTTSGARGESYRISTRVYDAGAVRHFRAIVARAAHFGAFPSLVFDPAEVPDSSLSHMVATLANDSAATASYHLTTAGIDPAALFGALEEAREPVVLFGTAFAFVELLDHPYAGAPPPLPAGSVLVETGGFKGRSREISRDELYRMLSAYFRCPIDQIRSEYSMTELSSQLYSLPWAPPAPQELVPPHWCSVSVVDPSTLRPLPDGDSGLVRFVDLANVDTVVAVQTSDVGTITSTGSLVLHGRAPGATPRGCSLAAEEIFEIAARRSGADT